MSYDFLLVCWNELVRLGELAVIELQSEKQSSTKTHVEQQQQCYKEFTATHDTTNRRIKTLCVTRRFTTRHLTLTLTTRHQLLKLLNPLMSLPTKVLFIGLKYNESDDYTSYLYTSHLVNFLLLLKQNSLSPCCKSRCDKTAKINTEAIYLSHL